MRLPNGERAIIELSKLQDYCLSPAHPRGKNKARVFASVGIRLEDAQELRAALELAAIDGEAVPGMPSPWGDRFVVDFGLFRAGRPVRIRSTWIVRRGEELPRLTSCYVL